MDYNGLDRRNPSSIDLQQSLLKILSQVETMEMNLDIKLEAVKDKIGNIEEKVSSRISIVEKQLDTHCEDEGDINEVLTEHDKKWQKAETYVDRIIRLENKYRMLNEKVGALETAPIKKDALIVTDIKKYIRNALMTAIGASVIGLLGFFILQYVRTL